MSIDSAVEDSFRPEVRRQGERLFGKAAVSIANHSDTQVQAYVKGASSFRVSFQSEDIASPGLRALCSCPVAARGETCKHMWATLRLVGENFPEFLLFRRGIEVTPREKSPAAAAIQVKRAEFKAQQTVKLKARAKEQRAKKKGLAPQVRGPHFSPAVESALSYFAQNGFPMENPIQEEALCNAKKKLSRVFHPDRGGTHEEVLTLNQNFSVLLEFLGS